LNVVVLFLSVQIDWTFVEYTFVEYVITVVQFNWDGLHVLLFLLQLVYVGLVDFCHRGFVELADEVVFVHIGLVYEQVESGLLFSHVPKQLADASKSIARLTSSGLLQLFAEVLDLLIQHKKYLYDCVG